MKKDEDTGGYWIGGLVYRLITQRSRPRHIALGAGIGTFVSVLPIIPLQSVVALAINFLIGGNRMAALGFTWLSNPLFFYLDYRIGMVVLDGLPLVSRTAQIQIAGKTLTHFGKSMMACLVGGLVFGIILGTVAFIGVYWAAVATRGHNRPRPRAGASAGRA